MEKKTKHTPAPWVAEYDRHDHVINILSDSEHVCSVSLYGYEKDYNTPLILGAPDMLAMLQECFDTFQCQDMADKELKNRIDQLIKKATGDE